ncbi:MAG: HAD hydrolase-like protein [Nanoarchaeota archaeon]|nr:HAD hydrolase-like protein [Nanoarchaeota archaeon]
MAKPIIATTLSGLFINSLPWSKAHILWFKEAAEKLNDPSVNDWANKLDYFKGVDEVMKRLYPDLIDEHRTSKARKSFFESVCKYIEQHPEVKNQEIVNYFLSLKQDYQIALITTNTQESIDRILSISGLENLFDIVELSNQEEKDDKKAVFDRFIKNHNKPLLYIGGGRKDSYDYCAEFGINRVFANFEGKEEIKGVKSVHNLGKLKKIIENLIS